LINETALSMQMFSLQYFFFELSEYKVKMESSNHTEYIKRIKNIKLTKYIMLSIQTLGSLANIYIEFVEPDPFKSKNDDLNHSEVMRIVLVIAMIIRIMENLFMMFYAFHCIIYFLKMKINNLAE
jgi:hypothetical protein